MARRYRRRRYYRRPRRSLAAKIRRTIASTKEVKSAQVADFNGATITATTSYLMNGIDQGDSRASRDGEEIYTRSVGGRMTVAHNENATLNGALLRVVIYRPYQNDNLLSSLAYDDYIDPAKALVLFDKVVTVSPSNSIKVLGFGKKFYNKLIPNGMKTIYSGTTGSSIEKNPVYLVICSDQTTATEAPVVRGFARCYFQER